MREKAYRWLRGASEWAVLLPLWRRFITSRNGRGAAAIATGGLWLVAIMAVAAVASGGGNDDHASGESVAESRASPAPSLTATPASSRTQSPGPSATPGSAAQSLTTPTPTPAAAAPPAVADEGGAPPAPGPALTVVSSSVYTDDVGALHVAGEVRNNGGDYMEFVEISGTFFDGAGQVVASELTFTHADIVAPSEVAGFDLTIRGGAGLGVSRYELAVQGEVTAERPVSGLVVQEGGASVDGGGDLRIVGTVVNQSPGPAEFVKVIGTFYGADGTVMRSDFAYTDLDEIPPGGADTFELIVAGGGSAGIARYELKVEGFPV